MASKSVIKDKLYTGSYSRMVKAIEGVAGDITTDQEGLYRQQVTIETGKVSISNDELDCEFSIPFDDDTEANEAEIVVYNLTSRTINEIKKGAKITVTAGYNGDTGIIFSGYISKVITLYEDMDKITTINAIDSKKLEERDLESKAYAAGTKASYILRSLVDKLGLPVAVFKVARDHTYKDSTNVDGGIMDNIRKYADICGVSAYICKSKVYVQPLKDVNDLVFNLSADTGLLSATEYEETITAEDYTDTVKGYTIKMLLQHAIQTGSTINLSTKNVTGKYKVREGEHTYDGDEFITTVKAVSVGKK